MLRRNNLSCCFTLMLRQNKKCIVNENGLDQDVVVSPPDHSNIITLLHFSFYGIVLPKVTYTRKFDLLTTFGFLAALQIASCLNLLITWLIPHSSTVLGVNHSTGTSLEDIRTLLVWYPMLVMGLHVSWCEKMLTTYILFFEI